MTIAEKVQTELTRLKLTQDEAADKLGVSRISVNQLCNNRRRMTATMALKLERLTGVKAMQWMKLQAEEDVAAAGRFLKARERAR